MVPYAWSVELPLAHDAAIEKVTAALATQGFGILTRIDVDATMQKKLGVTFRPYAILGACNPTLAHQALQAEASVGILLPCNVVVEQHGEGSRVWVTDPAALFAVANRPDLAHLAEEVGRRLRLVVEQL